MKQTSAKTALRASGTALHRQVFVVLRDEIVRGDYSVSSVLPKEEALCERFGVSRITVRRALADLEAKGLVERKHGRGTFVRQDALPLARSQPSLSLIDGLRQLATNTQVQVLHVERVEAPPHVSSLLHLEPGEKAVHALRLRSVNGTPVLLTDAWVPARLGKKVTVASLRKQALYEILLAQGLTFGRVIQEVTAEICDPIRADWLKIEVGAPILKVIRVLHDLDAVPVQYINVTMTPERSRFLMDVSGDKVNTISAGQFVHEGDGR